MHFIDPFNIESWLYGPNYHAAFWVPSSAIAVRDLAALVGVRAAKSVPDLAAGRYLDSEVLLDFRLVLYGIQRDSDVGVRAFVDHRGSLVVSIPARFTRAVFRAIPTPNAYDLSRCDALVAGHVTLLRLVRDLAKHLAVGRVVISQEDWTSPSDFVDNEIVLHRSCVPGDERVVRDIEPYYQAIGMA